MCSMPGLEPGTTEPMYNMVMTFKELRVSAFRKKSKFLNLCGFSCPGPASFYPLSCPCLPVVDFYLLQEIKSGAS